MKKQEQTKQSWWKEVLCLQKVVATVLLISFSAGLVHSDIDLDGIPDAVDPFPETAVQAPRILIPTEGEVVYAPSREVTLSGTAEVGSEIKLFEEGISQALSCQEVDASLVSGTGLLLSKTTGGSSIDQVGLLTGGTVVDQYFYNTNTDSASTDWRTSATASWATEQKDDAIDGICDYQAGGAPDDRCGASIFPEQVIVLATSSRVYLFDAQLRTFWKSISVSGATSVVAENGQIFVGTETGVLVWDFANGIFSQTFTNELPGGSVISLDAVAVGATQYLLVGTENGTAVLNLETDAVLTAGISGSVVGAAITTSNRILWATETQVYISSEPVDLLANNWGSIDVSSAARFPFSAPGTVTAVSSDLIGLTTGVARVFDDGEGNLLVQQVTTSEATLPIGLSAKGEWISTTASGAQDVSAAGNNLDNVSLVTSVPAASGADADIFEFGGSERYLKSENTTDFSVSGKNITVGAWVRRPDFGGDGPFEKMISHGSGAGEGEWDYWLSAGENFFGYGLNADPYFFGVRTTEEEKAASAFTFALNQWQLLVGTYDGINGELRMYLDGKEQDQNILLPGINPVSLTGDIAMVDEELRIGWGYGPEFFNGDMATPFIAAETYSPEQVSLLHRYSSGWFSENATTTLRGSSDVVVDVSCDTAHKECFVLTDDGAVTRIDGNLFSGGITSLVAGTENVSSLTPTYLGTWECTHEFDTSGEYTVLSRTYWDGAATAIDSESRTFTVFAQAEQALEIPNILAFPDEFTNNDFASVLWTTDETEEDFFVAQIATDAGFQVGVREQLVQGHSARFDALDDAQKYYFRVKAQSHAGGISDWSEIVSLTTDLSAPETGAIENTDGRISAEADIHFSWETDPFSEIGSGILWYEVEVSTDQTFLDETKIVLSDDRLAATSISITGEQGKTYFSRVRAMDQVGNWSHWSESSGTLVDTTPPEEFSLDSLSTTTGTEAFLEWTSAADAESAVTAYEVWQKINEGEFVLLESLIPEARDYLITGLVDQASYTFKVLAKNGAGATTETSEEVVQRDTLHEGVPQWRSSSYSKSTTVSLAWSPDKDFTEATQYQIFRNGILLGTVDIDTTTFDDPNVHVSGEVFSYQVRAFAPASGEETEDIAGQFSDEHRVLIDTVVPTFSSYEIIGEAAVSSWRNKTFSLQVWGTDGENVFDPRVSLGTGFVSGVEGTRFRESGEDDLVPHNVPILISDSGNHSYEFAFRDRAANQPLFLTPISNAKLDKVFPTVTLSQTELSESIFEAQNGFLSLETLPYEITATDEHSGVSTYEISSRLDKNGDGFFRSEDGDILWTDWTSVASAIGTIAVPGEGIFQLRAAVTDVAGNKNISNVFTVKIDKQAPQIFSDAPSQPISSDTLVSMQGVDIPMVASGFSSLYYTKNGADPKTSSFPVRHEGTMVFVDAENDTVGGNFTIKYFATDVAGNESETHISTNNIIDVDTDGLPDWWEALYGGDIDPDSDADGDARTAAQEFAAHTIPTTADTDGDGIDDGAEILVGTDPLNGTDHAFRWISPSESATVLNSFTLLGTATPGAIAEVRDVVSGDILGTATVDALGRFALELSELADGDLSLKVQFQHPSNPLAVVESTTRNISVHSEAASQPLILNITDDAEVGPSTNRVLLSNLTPNSTAELFEILDNVVYSLGTMETAADGTGDTWLPRRSEERRIFVLDHSSWQTSEIINFEQGLFIEGIIFDENGDVFSNATIEVTDSQDSSRTVLSGLDGTYHVFVHPNTTYTYRVEADGFIPQQQSVTMAFDDVRINVNLLEADKEVSVHGIVADSEGALLSGVSVELLAGTTQFSAITNGAGEYSILVPADTTYNATFALLDHDTHSQSIEVLREDVLVNVTLVKQEIAVQVSGHIVSDQNSPLLGVSIVFISNHDESFETQSDASGNFQLALRRDRDYTVTFSLEGYENVAQVFSLSNIALTLPEITMTPLPEEVEGGGIAPIRGWSGRELDNPADSISDDWIPSMTYEESLEQVSRLNAGIAGQVKVKEIRGEETFAGYISGRIAVDNFKEGEDSKKLSITAFSDRVQALHASATIGHCLDFEYTTMAFRDVSVRSRWYESVAKIYSLGQMPLDKEYKFRPTEMISWETALEMAFAVHCSSPDSFELLQSFRQDQWANFPLQNTLAARRAYTALDMGWVSYENDLNESPTRAQLLQLWMKIFDVPVDADSTKTSFKDVQEKSELAPVLVAARKLDLVPASSKFRPESLLPRSEAAKWFVSFFEAERAEKIDRSVQENQFDDHKVATGREVTTDEQVRTALLQKEVAEARRVRISETVPVSSDLDIEGNSGFVRRKGEDREDFLKRLAVAKETSGAQKIVLDYDALREKSLASRGVVEKTVTSKIKYSDVSGFVRRQDESREDFLKRLALSKQELEAKKLALQPTSTMKASAPKLSGPTMPTQNLGKLKIEIDTDRMCNIKMSWETSEMFIERCGNIREEEKETAYKNMFDSLKKRPGIQETIEPVEVTVTSTPSTKDTPTLKRSKMDVVFRRVDPELEKDEQTVKIKTRKPQSSL